jgi:tetratricopeptide (TPR) repeat protein
VLRNEYGDCKDKHGLLESLLKAAGIDAYPVLINSSHKLDPDVPSPGQFDHVISVVPQGKSLVWLDTTPGVSPFGLLLANLRDKQALVVTSGKAGGPGAQLLPATIGASPLIKTPADPPFKADVTFRIDAKLDDKGTLTGHIDRSVRGDPEVLLRLAFRNLAQTQWKDLVQQISYGSGFSGDVSEVVADSPESTNGPFHFSYNYDRKEYPEWLNNKRITPPTPLQAITELKDDKEAASDPVELGAPGTLTTASRVQMPAGYSAKLLQPVDIVRDFGEFHASYGFKDGAFTVEYRLLTKTRELPASRRGDYQSFAKAVNKNLQTYTDFESAGNSAPASPNPAAAELLQQARQAMQTSNSGAAIGLLEDAVKADPKSKEAWGMLGFAHFGLRQVSEGEEALRKLIALDPTDPRGYKVLAFAYLNLHRPQDAEKAYRDLLKVAPADVDGHLGLAGVLSTDKKYVEAIPEYEAVLKSAPGHPAAQLGLAHAYVATGESDKGLAAYQKAVAASPRPVVWNNAAWDLADAKQHLPEALEFAEKAVSATEAEAGQIHLDTLKSADLRCMNELAMYWDTLGWVYFRQGELAKAASYLEASWSLSQRSEVGDHLAQVYEKQGKKTEAAHLKMMANSQNDVSPIIRRKPTQRDPNQYFESDAQNELSQMRMLHLPRPAGVAPGSAEFFVLIGPGAKVEDVKFISGADQLKPLAKQIAVVHYVAPVPEGSQARLVRRGILMCTGTAPRCDFALIPPDTVFSTN